MVLFKAACLEADVLNSNDRIYSYETMNAINQTIQQSIKTGNQNYYGYNITEDCVDFRYQNKEAFKIIDSKIDGNKLWILAKTISVTISGKILETMLNENLPIYIVPFGTGYVNTNYQVLDYALTGFHYTNECAFHNLSPAKIINEINDFTLYNDNDNEKLEKLEKFNKHIKQLIDEIIENEPIIN